MANVYFSFILLVIFLAQCLSETQDLNLLVTDSKTKEENPKFLVKHVDDSLKLICELRDSIDEEIKLKWILPDQNRTFDDDDEIISNETSFDPTQSDDKKNESLKLYVSRLKVSDSGLYICEALGNITGSFNHTIQLFVKLRKESCGKMFECEDNNCIAGIYKCDGFPDCKSKNDEAPEICGENPCKGRIICSTGRCIPKEWCNACDPLKVNCTNRLHKHDCCQQLSSPFANGYGDGSHYHRFNDMSDSPNMEHHYDLKFIQTTIYTIIGCAIVFMIIVSILVIAICRVHMKRSLPSNLPNNRRAFVTTAYRRCTQDIDYVDVPGLLVTYNINNGVQIVGSPVEPPPYSEIASQPPPEGPPPPYTLSQLYEGPTNVHNVRLLSDGTSAKPGSQHGRHGLSHARVSSEPSLLNVNRL